MAMKVLLFPLTIVSSLFGTMPMVVVRTGPVKFKKSTLLVCHTCFLAILSLLNVFATLHVVYQAKRLVTHHPALLNNCSVRAEPSNSQYMFVQAINPLTLLAMSLGAHWVSVFRLRTQFPNLIEYFVTVDRQLAPFADSETLRRTYLKLALQFFTLLAISCIVFATYIYIHSHESTVHVVWYSTLVLHNLVSYSCELQLLAFLLLIKSRFQILNASLCAVKRSTQPSVQDSSRLEKFVYRDLEERFALQRVYVARSGYLKLVACWALLNHIYAAQVLFSTSGCFLKGLFNVYFIFSGNWLDPSWSSMSVAWMVFYFSRFALLAAAASSGSKEANKIREVISHASDSLDGPAIKEELDIFWKIASSHSLHFSTWGLYRLDSELVTRAFVNGVTYLVLLIQFRPPIVLN